MWIDGELRVAAYAQHALVRPGRLDFMHKQGCAEQVCAAARRNAQGAALPMQRVRTPVPAWCEHASCGEKFGSALLVSRQCFSTAAPQNVCVRDARKQNEECVQLCCPGVCTACHRVLKSGQSPFEDGGKGVSCFAACSLCAVGSRNPGAMRGSRSDGERHGARVSSPDPQCSAQR